jgi:hypothetical protein
MLAMAFMSMKLCVDVEIKKGWFTEIAANNREGDGTVTF